MRTGEAETVLLRPGRQDRVELVGARVQPVDFKSTLQERLAQNGEVVDYAVTAEEGPPHDRTFEVSALISGRPVASGRGKSKKAAEQEAARLALESLQTPTAVGDPDD